MSETQGVTIEGLVPLAVEQPASAVELGEIVRQAVSSATPIYPLGGKTSLDFGLPPTRPGIAIDLSRLDEVIDYAARDMTITVRAGISIERLQGLLATENQWLPIEVPHTARATLGGVLATNHSGPRRLGAGTLRDYVIGITVVNDEGHEASAGGRVVKNVAGYDLCKLHLGALGTLGIISSLTLKVKPRPESQGFLALPIQNETADGLAATLELIHASRTRPAAIELLNRAAVLALPRQPWNEVLLASAPSLSWLLLLAFEDTRVAVDWQLEQLEAELPEASRRQLQLIESGEHPAVWEALSRSLNDGLCFKANVLPSAVPEFCLLASRLAPEVQLQAHAGNGIVLGRLGTDLTLMAATTMLNALREFAVATRGNLVVPRCPTEWKQSLPIWGAPRGDAALMRAVKEEMDPKRIFNPGRFLQGI